MKREQKESFEDHVLTNVILYHIGLDQYVLSPIYEDFFLSDVAFFYGFDWRSLDF